MRLLITDPTAVVADYADVTSLRAEDESGGFGILTGHADLLTVLPVSVVSWRHADGRAGYCVVRRGVLTVQEGTRISIATREAQRGDDLDALESSVLVKFRAEADAERTGRVAATRLHTEAIRRIVEALRPERQMGDRAVTDEPNGLLRSVRRQRNRYQTWLREGEPSRAGRHSRMDDRCTYTARRILGALDRSASRDRDLLDRTIAFARPRGWLLVRVAVDARTMTLDAGFVAFGILVGSVHFLLLRWNATLYARPGRIWVSAGLQLARITVLGALLAVAAAQGALPLLLMALGVLIARPVVTAAVT
jgi:F-type H+-transporting ATPase subunit epsilon